MIGAIERGTRTPKRDHVDALESVFTTNGALHRRWTDSLNSAEQPDWYRQVVTSEERATEIRTWHPFVMPGLLQTPGYARAIFSHGRPTDSSDQIEKLVKSRCRRLDVLTSNNKPDLWVVIPEDVIRSRVGGIEAMQEQLAHLLNLVESGTIHFQVLPQGVPNHAGLSGAIRLLGFTDKPPLAYCEHSAGGALVDDMDVVRRLSRVFSTVQAWALNPEDTVNLVKETARELV
nr:DUF5753 domain-containing protein [Nocardiopsis gilva]